MQKALERCEILGRYIAENNATVRSCAAKYGISKSTVHKDVTQKLSRCDPSLGMRVREVLEKNKAERHIRGGMATKEKYMLSRMLSCAETDSPACCEGDSSEFSGREKI